VWEASPGDKRLVAYVVPRKNQPWEWSELRTFVQQQLPDYLLPSGWVALEALPMSANGKVNRRALPDPSESLGQRTAQVAPRTPTEAVIVKLFAQLLGVEGVGVEENFFDIGGHSLLATQLVSRLIEAFDLQLPLRTLFSSPTPAALAVIIDKMKVTADTNTKIDAPKITKISRERRRVQRSSQEELKLPDSLKNLNSGINIQKNDPNQ
jgi:acyl carrier protein